MRGAGGGIARHGKQQAASDFQLVLIGLTSATMTWQNGTGMFGFRLELRAYPSNELIQDLYAADSDEETFINLSLQDGSWYYARIKGYNEFTMQPSKWVKTAPEEAVA